MGPCNRNTVALCFRRLSSYQEVVGSNPSQIGGLVAAPRLVSGIMRLVPGLLGPVSTYCDSECDMMHVLQLSVGCGTS